MSEQNLLVRIVANARGYVAGMNQAGTATQRFGAAARAELGRLKEFAGSIQGQLAGLGLAVGLGQITKDAAVFERDMRQMQVALGAGRDEMEAWRREAYDNQKRYGALVSDQKALADSLAASGLDLNAIRAAATPVSKTLAVAKTNADQLGKALGVAREQFGIDISDSRTAALLLDKMVVAGRMGNAELENLPDIFARVGGRAKEANFTLEQTLALTEALSKSEPQADRLATLVDSTLRVFTNAKYMQDATDATGVEFFDTQGARRNPLDVLRDIKVAYDRLRTDAERNNFIDAAFGKTDMDTQRGLKKALEDGTLESVNRMHSAIQNAGGTIDRDLQEAMDNAVTQANRLKGALKEAVEDGLIRPLSEQFSNVTRFVMDDKSEGGLGMDGKDMMAAGAGIAATAYLGGVLARRSKGKGAGVGGSLAGDALGLGKGVAVGKALEHAGIQSVYVVNMPDSFGGGTLPDGIGRSGSPKPGSTPKSGGRLGSLRTFGSRLAQWGAAGWQSAAAATPKVLPWARAAGYAGAPLGAMYGVTKWAEKPDHSTEIKTISAWSDKLDRGLRKMFGWAGYETRQEKHLRSRSEQLAETSPKDAQAYRAQYERIKALLDGTAQQSETAIKGAGEAAAKANEAVGQALAASISQSRIEGNIHITVSAPPAVQVQTAAVGNGNTTLNVGKTNTGAK
ncbi:phage tail tape measure protein [Neisseria leonii]|uniref:Phage tail tape measure protein n=1 Tax=Neisseria leonii TaxID=2995413 RepID=A0A9X4E471_9NEIS|nr:MULTISPECIES: phage tail tape measure protein [unclassified Neisseria]MDD9324746.1 phage tail tape measure protein [Neisseria sp. 3986]MDD9327691.1 phage tail tape measure protein [Neisseria sp. 51.81]